MSPGQTADSPSDSIDKQCPSLNPVCQSTVGCVHYRRKQGMYNEARKRPEEATAWYDKILEDGSADLATLRRQVPLDFAICWRNLFIEIKLKKQ